MNATGVATMRWRRLDVPGHDVCRLAHRAGAWHLEGAASFRHEHGPARIGYHVVCDGGWRTLHGSVRGMVGSRSVSADIVRLPDGGWTLRGERVMGLQACIDLDFGFTPATNFTQLQRCALAIGTAAEVPVAWFDVDGLSLHLLPQRYERRGATTYWYEAPTVPYAALLELAANGFVARYPGLWQAAD